ncbi:hypothetical protein [Weissella fangxianensis]|uniref:hypothetical protein n=1 Tax=Weissella fangxianensis TaxID=2953879 RepID=UPI00215740DA|nr:hypothetical protein [Weissella fangxianensis]
MKFKKQCVTGKRNKIVPEIKDFEHFVKKMATSDSLLSRQQLTKLTQMSQVTLRPLQLRLNGKLPNRPLNLSLIVYKNDVRLRRLHVILPTGEVTDIYQFLNQLNALLIEDISEDGSYDNIMMKSEPSVQVATADKLDRANQTLKQRIKKLTETKIQLASRYEGAQVKVKQQANQLATSDKQNQELQLKIGQLKQTIKDYQFKFAKQKEEMGIIREQIRIKQTKQKRKKLMQQSQVSEHVCPKLDDTQLKKEITDLHNQIAKAQQELQAYKKQRTDSLQVSRSEKIRQLTSELNLNCIEDYHPLLRLVHKYNELVAEDLALWQQIQGRFVKADNRWQFIDQNSQSYELSELSLNGILLDELTTNYYYSARQRSDTGHIMLIRRLTKQVTNGQIANHKNEMSGPVRLVNKQVLIISWWGETVKNAAKKLSYFGIDVVWLDPSDISNDKIMHEMNKTQYVFELIVMRGAHHETVTAAHRLRRSGRQVKVANNPGASAMFDYVSGALGLTNG